MTKGEQLYEGKAKKVFATDDPEKLIVDYKDDALQHQCFHIQGIFLCGNEVRAFRRKSISAVQGHSQPHR